jgi:uncharacterized membrane protein YjdF
VEGNRVRGDWICGYLVVAVTVSAAAAAEKIRWYSFDMRLGIECNFVD